MSGVEFRDAKDRKRHWPQVSKMWLQLEQLPLPCTAFPFLWWWLSIAARAAPGSYNLKFLTITSTFSHTVQEIHLEMKLQIQISIAVEKGSRRDEIMSNCLG